MHDDRPDDSVRWHAEVGVQEEQWTFGEQTMSDTDKISAAMAKAFPAIEGAVKGRVNPAFRSKYADLSAVIDAIKPHLAEHGLWFMQRTHPVDGGVGVETVIFHASGQSISGGVLRLPAAKQDPQGYGSALTYCRRYSLMAAFGVPAEDDDGNAASGRQEARKTPVAPADDGEAAVILDSLREAAMEGVDALRERLAAIPSGAAKRAVWEQHGAALKAAAEKVAA
jgi:hypothetical protein